MSFDPKPFVSLKLVPTISFMMVDGTHMPLADTGSISKSNLNISDVYYIPNLTLNLPYVSQLYDLGYFSTQCYMQDPQSERMIGTSSRQGGLYLFDELKVPDVVMRTIDLSSRVCLPSKSCMIMFLTTLP